MPWGLAATQENVYFPRGRHACVPCLVLFRAMWMSELHFSILQRILPFVTVQMLGQERGESLGQRPNRSHAETGVLAQAVF